MSTVRAPAAPVRSRIYEKIIWEALRARRYTFLADLVADVKRRCAELRIPYAHHEVDDALAAMGDKVTRELQPAAGPERSRSLNENPAPGLTREEAAACVARISARVKAVPAAPKVIPNARPLTDREADKRAALRVVMQAIREQAQRCEDVER
jgi:hypothetical protein